MAGWPPAFGPGITPTGEAACEAASLATTGVCQRCVEPFDTMDISYLGRAQYRNSPFCRSCVDRCHDSASAEHCCIVCQSPHWGRKDGADVPEGSVISDDHLNHDDGGSAA
jgi:hypothetical protein